MTKKERQGIANAIRAVQIGSIIKDNDPRMVNRRLVVNFVGGGYVSATPINSTGETYGHSVTIRANRIFTDGKARRYGFNLELKA